MVYPAGGLAGNVTYVKYKGGNAFVTSQHILDDAINKSPYLTWNFFDQKVQIRQEWIQVLATSDKYERDVCYFTIDPKYIAKYMVGVKPLDIVAPDGVFKSAVMLTKDDKSNLYIDFSSVYVSSMKMSHMMYTERGFSGSPIFDKETGKIIGLNSGCNGLFGIGGIAYMPEYHSGQIEYQDPFKVGKQEILDQRTDEVAQQLLGKSAGPYGHFSCAPELSFLQCSDSGVKEDFE
jgi:hypothetical protein